MLKNALEFIPIKHRLLMNSHHLSWRLTQGLSVIKHALLCSMLAILVSCGSESGQGGKVSTMNEKPSIILESVRIDNRSVQFYINFGMDNAVLGFSVENDAGQQRYFPMFGSTYRDIPSVTLDVFVSNLQDEMWVLSSWSGYEILAYHRMGTDRCMTQYGEIGSFDKPTPEILGGGTGTKLFPEMDIKKLSKVATLKYGAKSLGDTKVR